MSKGIQNSSLEGEINILEETIEAPKHLSEEVDFEEGPEVNQIVHNFRKTSHDNHLKEDLVSKSIQNSSLVGEIDILEEIIEAPKHLSEEIDFEEGPDVNQFVHDFALICAASLAKMVKCCKRPPSKFVYVTMHTDRIVF